MGSSSSSGRRSYRYAGSYNVRRIEEKSVQTTNAYVATKEREETPNEGRAAQQLEQILASGPPPAYRRAHRIHPGALRVTHMVRELLLDSEPDRAVVLVETAHETIR
jgi:hypothetical protein